MTTTSPTPDALDEGITIILGDLGVTLEELDARAPRFGSDGERRAWFLANDLRTAVSQ